MESLLGNLEMMEAASHLAAETDIKQELIEFDGSVEELITYEKQEEFQIKVDLEERHIKYVNTHDYLDIGETVVSEPNRATPDVSTSPEAATSEEVEKSHARKRRASSAFSDHGANEEFRGFDLSNLDDSAVEYNRVIERIEAEISEARLTCTPVRTVTATLAPVPGRGDKRLRQHTMGKSTEVYLIELENKEAINADLKILKKSGIDDNMPTFTKDKQLQEIYFACDMCETIFSHKKAMQKHMTQIHETIKCKFCPLKFGEKKACRKHIANYHLEKKFECEICPKKFGGNTDRDKNIAYNHLEKKFECDVCKKKFSHKTPMRVHIIGSHGTNIKCHFCPLKFGRNTDRDKHIAYNHLEKKFECQLCHKKFACDQYLHRHLASHENERLASLSKTYDDIVVYKCGICNKDFYNAYILYRHQAVHIYGKYKIKKKPFSCEICSQDFNTMKILASHKRLHGKPSFDCDICKIKLPHKDNLRKHMQTHAVERKYYACKLCDKSFLRNYLLTTHYKRAHNIHKEEKKKSAFALNLTALKCNLTTLKCEICEKQYSSRPHLKRHFLIHTEGKKHACGFCKKKFLNKHDLTVHIRTHTGEKPYACTKCNSKFVANSNLRAHERQKHNIYKGKLKRSEP